MGPFCCDITQKAWKILASRLTVRAGYAANMQDNTSALHMCSPPLEEPPNWESDPDQKQWTTQGSLYRGRTSEGVEEGGAELGAEAKFTKSWTNVQQACHLSISHRNTWKLSFAALHTFRLVYTDPHKSRAGAPLCWQSSADLSFMPHQCSESIKGSLLTSMHGPDGHDVLERKAEPE